MRKILKLIGCYIGLSVFIGLMWVAVSYPVIPSTLDQWLWVFVLALPLQLAGEFVANLLWRNKLTRLVEQKTSATPFSLVRILYGVLFLLLSIGALLGAAQGWHVLRSLLGFG